MKPIATFTIFSSTPFPSTLLRNLHEFIALLLALQMCVHSFLLLLLKQITFLSVFLQEAHICLWLTMCFNPEAAQYHSHSHRIAP